MAKFKVGDAFIFNRPRQDNDIRIINKIVAEIYYYSIFSRDNPNSPVHSDLTVDSSRGSISLDYEYTAKLEFNKDLQDLLNG